MQNKATFEVTLKTFVQREGFNPIVILNWNEYTGKIDLIKNTGGIHSNIGIKELKEIFELYVKMFQEQLEK